MKNINSIFIKIGLFILPVVLTLDLLVLYLTYNITYNNNLTIYKNQITNDAKMAVQYSEFFDFTESGNEDKYSKEYDSVCKILDTDYIFAEKLDIENDSETYLAIGFGENASNEAKETRYPGVTVEGYLNEAQKNVYTGKSDKEVILEKDKFGESLICYMLCTDYYDNDTLQYKEYDEPVLIGTEISLASIIDSFQQQFRNIAILTVSLTVLMVVAFGVILYFKVSKPVKRISKRMSEYVTNRENEKHEEKLVVKGHDEFALMASSFNTMTEEIDRYLDDIDTLTRDKHTQEAELNIARRIQMGLLRPDRLDNNAVRIDGYMLPAKDVGGDLYDYQVLDDGRVFVAIADVSGKGISGALFMSRAITLLHQFILRETSPAKILSAYNDTLAAQNPGGLFITTFLAVWDPLSGELTYSNAGHNFPYILSDRLITLEGAHGIAAGLFEGEEYENATLSLKEGDTLFLYTDGVNEAKNAESAFYSTERLEKKLGDCIHAASAEVLTDILSDLNSFTCGAQQNDDITMLTLHIKDKPDEIHLQLSSELTQFAVIKDRILALDVSDDLKKKLILAAEEIFVNICSYAYDVPSDVGVRIIQEDMGISLTFTDSGKPFDPTADLLDIEEYDHENAVGGLGRFLTFSVADRYHYEYQDGKNSLYLFFSEVKSDDHNKNS